MCGLGQPSVDPKLIGTIQSGVPVYSIDELEEQLEAQGIEIALLTVPQKRHQLR